MTKVTSKYGKDYNYDYYTVHINLDRNDPYQKKCIDVLSKVGRKKGQLISILINQFLSGFTDPESISEKDLKSYLDYYELATKMKNPIPLFGNGITFNPPGSVNSDMLNDDTSKVAVPDPVPEAKEPMIDSVGIMNAMNAFTV